MVHGETVAAAGWVIDGFQAMIAVWVWVAAVVLFGLWRSFYRSEPDSIRPSGPIE